MTESGVPSWQAGQAKGARAENAPRVGGLEQEETAGNIPVVPVDLGLAAGQVDDGTWLRDGARQGC